VGEGGGPLRGRGGSSSIRKLLKPGTLSRKGEQSAMWVSKHGTENVLFQGAQKQSKSTTNVTVGKKIGEVSKRLALPSIRRELPPSYLRGGSPPANGVREVNEITRLRSRGGRVNTTRSNNAIVTEITPGCF